LLRPGRFDRIVYVPPPDEDARFEILKVHVGHIKRLSDEVKNGDYEYLRNLARRTEGYTGADLAALVKEAAMLALRETIRSESNDVRPVSIEHFEEALKRVPPSLTKQDIARYEEIAKNLRRALRGL